jgi:hypothetical protein
MIHLTNLWWFLKYQYNNDRHCVHFRVVGTSCILLGSVYLATSYFSTSPRIFSKPLSSRCLYLGRAGKTWTVSLRLSKQLFWEDTVCLIIT